MLELKPELAVIDLSFISLSLVLPVVRELMTKRSEAVCLIKPQFEAGKDKVGKKGVVREPGIHKEVLDRFIENAEKSGFYVNGITYSPVKGPKGNIEYLGRLSSCADSLENNGITQIDTGKIVSESHKDLA
jgi:23S rRNA (cytidine1920-2'-O)/16S rRNA (cytidine1409-2'-O)-methyltransferase